MIVRCSHCSRTHAVEVLRMPFVCSWSCWRDRLRMRYLADYLGVTTTLGAGVTVVDW